MKRRSFLKGLLGLSAVSIAGCMRPPNAKVMPAILDCDTAMSDSPACTDKPMTAAGISNEALKQIREAQIMVNSAPVPTNGRMMWREGVLYRG